MLSLMTNPDMSYIGPNPSPNLAEHDEEAHQQLLQDIIALIRDSGIDPSDFPGEDDPDPWECPE